MSISTLLSASDIFANAKPVQLDAIASSARIRRLERGETLFEAGDESSTMYIVERGRIAIATKAAYHGENVLALMEHGEVFGELPLLDGQSRSALARAIELTDLVEIPYEPVRALLLEEPLMLWNVSRLLAQRIRSLDEALADAHLLDVTARTAKQLLRLSHGSDSFVMPITQEELASMVGASRERVNKAISAFSRLGWLAQFGRTYTILQRDRLQLRAA